MGDSVEVSGFWLPSEFLTDDDFLMDKDKNNSATESATEFCFPTEFPYHFKPDNDENAENLWVMSTSPQSTLANMGSPNGAPKTTSFGAEYDAVGDLISRAAGQVAMLKLSGGGDRFGFGFGPGPNKDTRFMAPHRCFVQHAKNPTPSVLLDARNQNCGVPYGPRQMYGNRGEMGVREMGQAAWSIQQNPTRVGSGGRAVMVGGSGGGVAVKRGTGVFLPRRYENNNTSDSRKRLGGGSTTLIPNRAAAHASNKSIDTITGFSRSQLLSQPMFNRGFIQDYDLLMARRHALRLHLQRSLLLAERSSMISRETCLPQEWTY